MAVKLKVYCTGSMELPDNDDPLRESPMTGACGVVFTIDANGPWDVKTDKGGSVISRHRSAVCPDCGTATFVKEG